MEISAHKLMGQLQQGDPRAAVSLGKAARTGAFCWHTRCSGLNAGRSSVSCPHWDVCARKLAGQLQQGSPSAAVHVDRSSRRERRCTTILGV